MLFADTDASLTHLSQKPVKPNFLSEHNGIWMHRVPPHEYSQRQPNEQDVFQNDLNEEPRGWSWQRRRGAERQNNQVHDDKNAKSIQERARDDIMAQERNSVGAQDKNASDYNAKEEVE